ncbi:MAG: hypothetical protein H0U95_07700 [Bacteroidetes bacterium]|nr:hypothetical protein [Bacteroidota bacterium]
MKAIVKSFFLAVFVALSFSSFSQDPTDWSKIKLDPIKEKKFQPYLEIRHTGPSNYYQDWKANNKFQYVKEMWYFTESFYIKRNVLQEGAMINEEAIDISRFESNRKATEEAIITLSGFEDAIVLLPTNKLIYKP